MTDAAELLKLTGILPTRVTCFIVFNNGLLLKYKCTVVRGVAKERGPGRMPAPPTVNGGSGGINTGRPVAVKRERISRRSPPFFLTLLSVPPLGGTRETTTEIHKQA